MLDRGKFLASLTPTLFAGHLSASQAGGLGELLDEWFAWLPANGDIVPNPRWLAYALATAFHETGSTFDLSIKEWGLGHGREYGTPDPVTHQIYYGRGASQLTWKSNYDLQGKRLGIDLIHNPDLACEPKYSANILIHGMAYGQMTGRRLGEFFGANPANDDPINARRIINGLDCASKIAGYFACISKALQAGGYLPVIGHLPVPPPKPAPAVDIADQLDEQYNKDVS